MKDMLQGVSLVPEHNDSVKWALESKGHFTTKSYIVFLLIGELLARLLVTSGNAKFLSKTIFFFGKCSAINFRLLKV